MVCVLTAEAALLFFVMLRVECFSSWAVPRRRAASSAHTQPAVDRRFPASSRSCKGVVQSQASPRLSVAAGDGFMVFSNTSSPVFLSEAVGTVGVT